MTLEELKKIREEFAKKTSIRNPKNGYKVVVSMGTCGIEAGARPVLNKLAELVQEKELFDVIVTQSGCTGDCELEPVVKVFDTNGNCYTYCQVDNQKAEVIINEHVVKGNVVNEYLIENVKK